MQAEATIEITTVDHDDNHLSPAMEKFYVFFGILLVVVVILSVCLFLAKQKLRKILERMQQQNPPDSERIAGNDRKFSPRRSGESISCRWRSKCAL